MEEIKWKEQQIPNTQIYTHVANRGIKNLQIYSKGYSSSLSSHFLSFPSFLFFSYLPFLRAWLKVPSNCIISFSLWLQRRKIKWEIVASLYKIRLM